MKLRRKLLRATPEVLIELLRVPYQGIESFVVSEGIPEDLKIVGATWLDHTVVFTVESETFDEIEPGSEFPEMKILFHRFDIQACVLATEKASF